MKPQALATSLIALLASPALADDHVPITGYALANDGTALIVMGDVGMPATP